MTIEALSKAKEIQTNVKAINDIRQILLIPYPTILDAATNKDVSFVQLDKNTREGLKELMLKYLQERENVLMNEFEAL